MGSLLAVVYVSDSMSDLQFQAELEQRIQCSFTRLMYNSSYFLASSQQSRICESGICPK